MKITMGKTYEDGITGFKGVCTGIAQYLTGCTQMLLVPKAKEKGSDYQEGHRFDWTRLKMLATPKVKVSSAGDAVLDPGGPLTDREPHK